MSDLIKREDAIKAVLSLTMYKGSVPADSVIYNIKHIPSAENKGEWIDENNNIVPFDKDGCPRGWCKCSKCGDYLSASDEYAVRGFFCPNCGARMFDRDTNVLNKRGAYDERFLITTKCL